MKLSQLSALSFAALGFVVMSTGAHAQFLHGSLPLAGISVTENGTDLANSTVISNAFAITTSQGAGDYSPIPNITIFGTTSLTLAAPTSFSISNATYGGFTATTFTIVKHTATFYDVELFGTYTPGAGLGAHSATPGELRVSINQSGSSISEAITLSTPPSTPEPGAIAMLIGMGISGSAFAFRRVRRHK